MTVGYIGFRPAIWKGNLTTPGIGEKFQICQDGFKLPLIVGGSATVIDSEWEFSRGEGEIHDFTGGFNDWILKIN